MSCSGLHPNCPHVHCTNVHINFILNFILHLEVMFPPIMFSHGINKLASGTRILSWLAKAKQPCKASSSHQYVELKIGEHCQDTWCKPYLSYPSFSISIMYNLFSTHKSFNETSNNVPLRASINLTSCVDVAHSHPICHALPLCAWQWPSVAGTTWSHGKFIGAEIRPQRLADKLNVKSNLASFVWSSALEIPYII